MFLRQLPNLLCLIRILLVPVIYQNYTQATNRLDFILCGVLLLISGITDIADGLVARKFEIESEQGKILDPLADKITQITVMLALSLRYRWMIPFLVLIIIKDVSLIALGAYLRKQYQYKTPAKWYGKLATFVFYVVTIVAVVVSETQYLEKLEMMFYALFVVMLFAGVMYGLQAVLFLHKWNKQQAKENREAVLLADSEVEIVTVEPEETALETFIEEEKEESCI